MTLPIKNNFDFYISSALYDMELYADTLAEAEKGDTEAMYQIGYQYRLKNEGFDYEKAIFWYTQAASRGHPDACNDLGYMYLEGCPEIQNYQQALAYFKQASTLGSKVSHYNLGHAYMNGLGVPINYKLALKWYRKAAAKGYAKAQNNIGYMYQNGLGMNPNYKRALSWYQSAACQADSRAQYHLGEMHEKGQGGVCDIDEAINWYTLSARQGDRDSLVALRRLSLIRNESLLALDQSYERLSNDSQTVMGDQEKTQNSNNGAKRNKNNKKKRRDKFAKKEEEEKHEKQNMLARIKYLEDQYDKSMHILEYISNSEENNNNNNNENIVNRITILEEQIAEQNSLNRRFDALHIDHEERKSMSQRLKMIENMIEQINIDVKDPTDQTKGNIHNNTRTNIFF